MLVRRWGGEEEIGGPGQGAQVVRLADGSHLVAWIDAADPSRLLAQRFDAAGAALGPLLVADHDAPLLAVSVAALAGGGFVLGAEALWSEGDHDALAFLSDGAAVAGPLALDAARGSSAAAPVLAALGEGFVAVHGRDGDVVATWLGAGGEVLGGGSAVNTSTAGLQAHADVAALAGGGFAVIWTDLNLGRVQARVFGPGGAPHETEETAVNATSLRGNPGFASVAGLSGGGFVVAWETDAANASDSPDIRARLFDAAGAPLGTDFLINASLLGAQRLPEVVGLRGGGFAVVWADLSGVAALRGQLFDAWGQRLGTEFTVGTTPLAPDPAPGDLSLAELADGRIAVAWRGEDGGLLRQIIDPRGGVVAGSAAGETLYGHDLLADEMSGYGGGDLLWGLRGGDGLYGGDGADRLEGGRGDDLLWGGRGDDRLAGGMGGDEMRGGAGQDVLTFAGAGAGVAFALDAAFAGQGDGAGDEAAGVEGVEGSAFADRLRGDGGVNDLSGGGGNDQLQGAAGADALRGGIGADTLEGGAGTDTLWGGSGADDFVFLLASDSPGGEAADRLADFSRRQNDDLVLAPIDADEGLAGDQAFRLDADGSFSAGELRQTLTAEGLFIECNTDADGTPELQLLATSLLAPLGFRDFVF